MLPTLLLSRKTLHQVVESKDRQGNDTDSFGCTCGSILGAYFGPEKLEERWLAPFNDTIHVALATFHEQRLSVVTRRMGQLPMWL